LSCKSKNDENYVKIIDKNHNLGAFFFGSCKNKNDIKYVENYHKNHNLIDLLVMQRANLMQNYVEHGGKSSQSIYFFVMQEPK